MSSDVVVRVEGLGKRFVAPRRGGGSLRHRMREHLKEFAPILRQQESDYFWALKNLNFDVKRGEILGILGANGSGKSTLLKILSGITLPTTGHARLKGRIGSLLEVGTGFHPDLTGRENIYFSGALLGVDQREIRSKFDEIVDFSGIEKFIDMPVKRYSSGMYVRLAYSVAAMLRSDILILDEVMAVGDAAFREKSQKNIEKAATDGRTVLFVSHNAKAVSSICTTGLILEHGNLVYRGKVDAAIEQYMRGVYNLDESGNSESGQSWHDLVSARRLYQPISKTLTWLSTHSADGEPTSKFSTGSSIRIRVGFSGAKARDAYIAILVLNSVGDRVATLNSTHSSSSIPISGDGYVECFVEDLRIGEGQYFLIADYGAASNSRFDFVSMDCVANAGNISVDLNEYVKGIGHDSNQGAVHRSEWLAVSDGPILPGDKLNEK